MVRRLRREFRNVVAGPSYYNAKGALSLRDVPAMRVRNTVQFSYDVSSDGYTEFTITCEPWTNNDEPLRYAVILMYDVLNNTFFVKDGSGNVYGRYGVLTVNASQTLTVFVGAASTDLFTLFLYNPSPLH